MDDFLNNFTAVIHNSTAARNPFWVAVETSINALLTISALVGNSLVCLAIYRNPSLRKVTNIFVLSLAITDLLSAVLIMPFNTASIINTKWITGKVGCKFNFYCANLLAGTSLMTIMLVAVNRYVRVVRSNLYQNIFSKTSATVMAVGAWILPSLIMSALLFIMTNTDVGTQTFHVYPASCYQLFTKEGPSKLFSMISIAYAATVSAVTVTCYVKIYQKIRHHNGEVAPSSQGGHSAYGVKEAMITKMLGVVVVAFFLCWLPFVVYSIVGILITIEKYFYKEFLNYIIFLAFSSCTTSPVVYTIFSGAFRREFRRIISF